jgi:hypothetical protein
MQRAVEVVALSRSDAEYMQQHLQQHLQQPGASSSSSSLPKVGAAAACCLPACLLRPTTQRHQVGIIMCSSSSSTASLPPCLHAASRHAGAAPSTASRHARHPHPNQQQLRSGQHGRCLHSCRALQGRLPGEQQQPCCGLGPPPAGLLRQAVAGKGAAEVGAAGTAGSRGACSWAGILAFQESPFTAATAPLVTSAAPFVACVAGSSSWWRCCSAGTCCSSWALRPCCAAGLRGTSMRRWGLARTGPARPPASAPACLPACLVPWLPAGCPRHPTGCPCHATPAACPPTHTQQAVKAQLRAAAPGALIVEDFLGARQMADIYRATLLNVHPCW